MHRRVQTLGIRLLIAAVAAATFGASAGAPASAQMRQQIRYKIVDDVANELVSRIQGDSCSQFAAMMKQKGRGSNSGRAGSMLKNDRAARERFVDKVAAPLVNKMIDCNLLPGR